MLLNASSGTPRKLLHYLRAPSTCSSEVSGENHLEQIPKGAAEVLDHLLRKPRPSMPCPRLYGGDVVLGDAEVVSELALRQAPLLAHRLEPHRPDLNLHRDSTGFILEGLGPRFA